MPHRISANLVFDQINERLVAEREAPKQARKAITKKPVAIHTFATPLAATPPPRPASASAQRSKSFMVGRSSKLVSLPGALQELNAARKHTKVHRNSARKARPRSSGQVDQISVMQRKDIESRLRWLQDRLDEVAPRDAKPRPNSSGTASVSKVRLKLGRRRRVQ
uniref:Uncharacterized protein n=1 Tax=Spongospora subterranea TaxID=70186 RepID=A0A0H5R553_9EUKA|eukprot:CRZ03264.1 hypothetical protein [Spongospora subterranea]